VALQAAGLLSPPEQERLTENQFRKIKRPVIANAVGKGLAAAVPNGHLVMLTSALPGEGKTFSSINLAFSLAREKDLEVLLIDADVAKPNVSNVFGMQDVPGLLDALADESLEVESLILRTDVDGLSILSAGHCESDTATELLASSRMEELVAHIAERNRRRIVVFDSPPLLLTNESQVLATLVGQIILVVRAGITPKPAVLEAVGLIGETVPVGLVLNQSRVATKGGYYGYGSYGYRYGVDVDTDQPPAK
jgi:exopolysaccharide/PEP-CTERM locus tyrosine autokinase